MTVFIMEYRVKGYGLQHVLSLNPKAGKRGFTVRSEDIGTTDINAVVHAASAPENTPDGYQLFSVRDRDSGVEVRND